MYSAPPLISRWGRGSSPDAASADSSLPAARPRRGDNVSRQRLLGAFYTPDDLAFVLTRWALSGRRGTVLDPSFGGCAFLRAAVTLLRNRRARRPERLVFGIDIDRKCMRYADGLVPPENCITADFLALRPEALSGAPFKAVVGNPPYVRHHWLKGAKRRSAAKVAKRSAINIPATASTWAYFVVHALDFLAPDGRLAFLVPEAILQADYATSVRDLLRHRFARVNFIHIRHRLFRETNEPIVIITAEGIGPGTVRTKSLEHAEDLQKVLEHRESRPSPKHVVVNNGRAISTAALELVDELAGLPIVSLLGNIATIRIGFVTGSNHFFIRSEADVKRLGIPARALERIVGRTRWLSGLAFTKDDHSRLTELGRRTLLVRPPESLFRHKSVKAWLRDGRAGRIDQHYKCALRDHWFQVNYGPRPDAFVTCSRMNPPLLVINQAGYRCSNAIHALTWRPHPSRLPKAVAVAFLGTLTALWAEIHARRYGGGILKLEPGMLRTIPIPVLPTLAQAFDDVDALMRRGLEERARDFVDAVVLQDAMGVSPKDVARLQRARRQLARHRLPTRTVD